MADWGGYPVRFRDVLGREVLLSHAAWGHVLLRHPEVESHSGLVADTLRAPERIVRSLHADDVLLYYRFYERLLGGKYLLVAARIEQEGWCVVTVYITDTVKSGEVLWLSR